MSDEAQGNWKDNVDLLLKILSGVLIPVTIVVAGHLISRQQQKDNDASLQQQRESDLAQRNVDRAANLLKSLSSDNIRERQLAVRVVDHLVKENKFPAELGPVLIAVSLSDPDPEVARVASETLPQVYKANPELEKTAVAETQRILKNSGYYDGAIDGTNSEKTRDALRRFQQDNGVESDGTVRSNTMQKLREAQQKRQTQGEQPAQGNSQKPSTVAPRLGRRGR
jgi:murein L,D-transpeptidase YcbB/YkuD